jgi:hypothetical protein
MFLSKPDESLTGFFCQGFLRMIMQRLPFQDYNTLRPNQIETVFFLTVLDLKQILVLDDIDIVPVGFRIRCHDLNGPLPELWRDNTGNTFEDKDWLGIQVCKLIAMTKIRARICRGIVGGEFLEPTRLDQQAIVGFRGGRKTWIAEGKNFIEAYHRLNDQVMA